MSIVVTGATGPFGRTVVGSLLERGVPAGEIVAGGRDPERLAELSALGVRAVELDYDRAAVVRAALEGAQQVLLVSGSDVGRRVEQHRTVLEAAVAAGARHVAYTSVLHADTTSLVVAPEHRATEAVLDDLGVTTTVLRNGWYTENFLPTVEGARATGEILTAAGHGRVASAARADYAEAAAVVLTDTAARGRTYELTGDVAWGFDELAEVAGRRLGREVAVRRVSPEDYHAALVGTGMDEAFADYLVALDRGILEHQLSETNGHLSALLGRPTTPMETTLGA